MNFLSIFLIVCRVKRSAINSKEVKKKYSKTLNDFVSLLTSRAHAELKTRTFLSPNNSKSGKNNKKKYYLMKRENAILAFMEGALHRTRKCQRKSAQFPRNSWWKIRLLHCLKILMLLTRKNSENKKDERRKWGWARTWANTIIRISFRWLRHFDGISLGSLFCVT